MTDNSFWQQRWQDNAIGFHQSNVNHFLIEYLPNLHLQNDATIFVPFCGASVDMAYLAQQGYQVIGSELSPIACEQFFKEQGGEFERHEVDDFIVYVADNIKLYCGDHYDLKPEWFTNVSAVYDRAALVAVEPTQRKGYVEKLFQLVPKFKSLLIAQQYDEAIKSGPPFSINETMLVELYQPKAVIKLAQTNNSAVTHSLSSRGYADVLECCYSID